MARKSLSRTGHHLVIAQTPKSLRFEQWTSNVTPTRSFLHRHLPYTQGGRFR
jgi:hypothetical protein